jgi:hypothetical protein
VAEVLCRSEEGASGRGREKTMGGVSDAELGRPESYGSSTKLKDGRRRRRVKGKGPYGRLERNSIRSVLPEVPGILNRWSYLFPL